MYLYPRHLQYSEYYYYYCCPSFLRPFATTSPCPVPSHCIPRARFKLVSALHQHQQAEEGRRNSTALHCTPTRTLISPHRCSTVSSSFLASLLTTLKLTDSVVQLRFPIHRTRSLSSLAQSCYSFNRNARGEKDLDTLITHTYTTP